MAYGRAPFTNSGGADPRDAPPLRRPRDIYIPDLHVDTLTVKVQDRRRDSSLQATTCPCRQLPNEPDMLGGGWCILLYDAAPSPIELDRGRVAAPCGDLESLHGFP